MGTSTERARGFIDDDRKSSEADLMRSEARRLSTFSDWPHGDKVEARKIAKAGFFRTGSDSEVKCTWCGCVLDTWNYGDQVMARHRSASPDCPFILNMSDNVPLIQGDQPQQQPQPQPSQSESEDTTDNGDDNNNNEEMDEGNSGRRSREDDDLAAFRSEAARLATFDGWTCRFVAPADLASAGFVYTGGADVVRCVFCGNYIGAWEQDDTPYVEHRTLYPECPFVQGLDVGNEPIQHGYNPFSARTEQTILRPVSRTSYDLANPNDHSFDETGIRARRYAFSAPEKGPSVGLVHLPNGSDDNIGIIRHSGPAHPKYSTVSARLRSFRDWPPALKQQPEQLAEAGFYYIGLSDQVKCFYCDGGLRNWQPDDDPWTEHSRWFSKCGFIRLTKGDDFIAACVEKKPPEVLSGVHFREQKHVSEDEMKKLMTTPVVQQALALGADQARVKVALKRRLRETGAPFATSKDLVEATRIPTEEVETRPVASTSTAESQITPTAGTETAKGIKDTLEPTKLGNLQLGDSSDLEQENRRLKEQRICKICMDQDIGVVFLPCGHLICCVQCAPALKNCPLCRQPIQGAVKTYMS